MNKNIAKVQKICCPICGYELTVETVSLNCPKCNCRFSFFDGNFIIENYNKNNIISGDSGIFLKSKSDILKFYKTLFVNHNGENISGFMNYGAITDEDYSEKEYSFDELSEILLKSIISELVAEEVVTLIIWQNIMIFVNLLDWILSQRILNFVKVKINITTVIL